MFIYEKGNSLNLTFKGSIPVDNPEVVIKGFVDGVTMTVNGTVFGSGSEEFEGKAKTLVYQKDGKLMITFRGVLGMESPEVVIDEVEGVYNVSIGSETVALKIDGDSVVINGDSKVENSEDIVPPVNEGVTDTDESDLLESVEGKGDSNATVEDL